MPPYRPVNTGASEAFAVFGGKIPRTPLKAGNDSFIKQPDGQNATSRLQRALELFKLP